MNTAAAPSEHGKAAQQRRYREKLHREAIAAYGGKCTDCGEEEVMLLELDHENEDGGAHRNKMFNYGIKSPGGWNFYLKLRQLGFPKDLDLKVRCIDCHDKRHPTLKNLFGERRRMK